MLVLTRNVGEEIVIDDNIRVQVLEIRRNVVRLGFNAPDDVSIHRREVQDRVADERSLEVCGSVVIRRRNPR